MAVSFVPPMASYIALVHGTSNLGDRSVDQFTGLDSRFTLTVINVCGASHGTGSWVAEGLTAWSQLRS
jgi:hypothetical protein